MIDKEDYVFTLKKRILRIRSKGHNGDLTTYLNTFHVTFEIITFEQFQSLQLHDKLL